LTHITARVPATLTLLGRHDRIVPIEQAELLQQGLTRVGVHAETWLLPAADHGFDANWGGFASQFARARIAAFLERH
jgi:dipeptidyl aminopeptidase/acylaminoacyl peptidase